jgi:hypothetical protein
MQSNSAQIVGNGPSPESRGAFMECLVNEGTRTKILEMLTIQGDNGVAVLTLLSVNKSLASEAVQMLIEHMGGILNISHEAIASKVLAIANGDASSRKGLYMMISQLSNYVGATINGSVFDVGASIAKDTQLPNVRQVERIFGPNGDSKARMVEFEWTVRACLSGDRSLANLRAYGVFSSTDNRRDMIEFIKRFRTIQESGEFSNPASDAVLKLLEGSSSFSNLTKVSPFPLDFYENNDHPRNFPRLAGFYEDVNPADVIRLNERLTARFRLSL